MNRHIFKRGKVWQWRRRVPVDVAHLDTRGVVQKSTKQRVEAQAIVVANRFDEETEAYWRALSSGQGVDTRRAYEAAMRTARALGLEYRPVDHLANDVAAVVERVELLQRLGKDTPKSTKAAVLGLAGDTGITLATLFEAYCDVVQDELCAKSAGQRLKWGNQRKRAIANLIRVIGDKPLAELDRDDALQYRDWWMRRVMEEGIDAGTANKDIGMLSSMTSRLDEHFRLGLDRPFANLRLKGAKKRRGLAFSNEWIESNLLADDAFASLNDEARMVVYVLVNTGLRLSEAVNLQRSHIRLDHAVPHVSVAAVGREIKTKDSEREMPLVGCSLEAMKMQPDGFPHYRDKEDSLSATLNKYMKENGLKETPAHTINSLRHSFQDRLTAAEPPDRVVADLMGHKYVRPKYGQGASLEQKRRWLEKIAYAAPASLKAS